MLALLCREPFSGWDAEKYARASDWQILHVLFAERDRDLSLVPLARRLARLDVRRRARGADLWQEPPTPDELGVPEEARALMPEQMPAGYIAMFWQRWRGRGLGPEAILERWKDFAARGFN